MTEPPHAVKQEQIVGLTTCHLSRPFGCGPTGIRTPDLLAASHHGMSGVLTSESAGRSRAERAKLNAVLSGELDPP
jgi:hypothetical protein